MFKLSLAFSAATLVVGQIDPSTFCGLLVPQCPVHAFANVSSCVQAFSGLGTPPGLVGDGDMNTIGCRQKYLDTAPFNANPDKCRYAGPSGGGRCGAVVDGVCGVAVQTCAGVSTASYTDVKSCTDAYTAATPTLVHQWGSIQGANAASEDSLECRVYHAIAGANDPVHCGHWGAVSAFCRQAITPDPVHYCETIQYNCNGTNTQYGSRGQCGGVAAGLPNTQMDARQTNSNNTLGCREYHAQASKAGPAVHCQHAGPSGGAACGTYTQAWASMLKAAPCRDSHVEMLVTTVSSTIVDNAVPPGFTAPYNIALDTGMNTQACRIYHLGVAANVTGHCSHGWVSGDNNCGTVRPNLCKFIGATCGWGTNASWQYADEPACNTAMTPSATQNFSVPNSGKGGDTTGNNYECRFYHAAVAASYKTGGSAAAATDATFQMQTHCSHVLANARAGCFTAPAAGASGAPTAAPAAKPSSAPEISLFVAGAAVFVSVFSL